MHATTKEAENNDNNSIMYAYLVGSDIRTYVYDPPFTIFAYRSIYIQKQRRFFVDNLKFGVQLAVQVVHQTLSCPQRIFVVSIQPLQLRRMSQSTYICNTAVDGK